MSMVSRYPLSPAMAAFVERSQGFVSRDELDDQKQRVLRPAD